MSDSTVSRPPSAKSSSKSSSSSKSIPKLTNMAKAAMNRFLTKKRAKKAQEAPKVELDLTAALPSSDDFRTSLIMPNLSARFSMLRDQDNPNSKLGKASDDSVLAPRRQSRLHEFGYHGRGLTDIAEVASISSFTRPPFAQNERGNSVVSETGYGTDDDMTANGSIMDRKRPGEGNNLFGGRQKVYMISAKSESEANLATSGMRGRALYEDDVNMSAFQKHRREEKERLEREALEEQSRHGDLGSPSKAPLYSPSLKRETSSSTATSSPSNGRTSTAATSITSQSAGYVSGPQSSSSQASSPSFAPPLERSMNRTRRLYEAGLDRDMKEQQSTSMTRLNSVQRPRAPTTGRTTPDPFQRAPSRTHDRMKGPNHPFRAQSPTPVSHTNGVSHNIYQIQDLSPSPPNSPPLVPNDQVLQAALDPNDRGKATAMGAFNKPKQFSEKAYIERQRTLNQGRNTPTPVAELTKDTSPKQTSPKKSILRNPIQAPAAGRPRALSTKEEAVPSAFSVFQRAAIQMKSPTINASQNGDKQRTFFASPDSDSDYEQDPEPEMQPPRQPSKQTTRNGRSPRIPVVSPSVAPPVHEHPAFRSQKTDDSPSPNAPGTVVRKPLNANHDDSEQASSGAEKDVDSPTLGPTTGGLSGLVRQHLRNASNLSDKSQTSIYPAVPPAAPIPRPNASLSVRTRDPSNAPTLNSDLETPNHSSYSHSNPWDLEDFDNPYLAEADSIGSISPVEGGRQTRQSTETTGTATGEFRRHALSDRIPEDESEASWEEQLRKSHNRNTSTETTQERIAFQNDIAARQKAIQEKLKEKMESEQRSASPTFGRSGPFRGLDLLRAKSSRESIKGLSEKQQSKPMKVLGIGSTTSLNKEPHTNSTYSDRGTSSDYVRSDESRSSSRPPVPRAIPEKVSPPQSSASYAPFNGRRRDFSREAADRQRPRKDSSVRGQSPSESQRSSVRTRSNSENSNGRSRSRSGRYKDDLDKAMAEGTSNRTSTYPEPSPAIPEEYSNPPVPSTDVLAQYADQQVNRVHEFGLANGLGIQSKPDSSLEVKGLHPPSKPLHAPNGNSAPRRAPSFTQPGTGMQLGLPSNPKSSPSMRSPGFLSPGVLSPSSNQSSRIPSPFLASSTPPISAATTPVVGAFPANVGVPMGAVGGFRSSSRTGTRKRSIQKHEISEPMLISTTSVIDTVDLPPEASLRNGMDDIAPSIPAMNPLRRRLGLGGNRGDLELPKPLYANGDHHSHSADESNDKPQFRSRHRQLRKSSSEGAKIGMRLRAQQEAMAMASSPSLVVGGHSQFGQAKIADGAMF